MLTLALMLALQVGPFGAESRASAQELAEQARPVFDRLLNDYTTARFRDVVATRGEHPRHVVLCGYVNARNRFGAYAGWERFIAERGADGVEVHVFGDSSLGDASIIVGCGDESRTTDSSDWSEALTYR